MPPQNYLVLRENILRAVGIQLEYGEPVEAGEYRGTFKAVGEQEHAEIIRLYVEGYGMAKIANELDRSSRTIHRHILEHDQAVARSRFFPACRRVHSEYEGRRAERI